MIVYVYKLIVFFSFYMVIDSLTCENDIIMDFKPTISLISDAIFGVIFDES